MKLTSVIFDFDGTVADTENIWAKAFMGVLGKLGVAKIDEHPQIRGADISANWEMLIKKYGIVTTQTPEELLILTYHEYEKYISEVKFNEGFLEFADLLKEQGVEIGLATSTRWETLDKIFIHLSLDGYFDSVTTGDEVARQKPDPEIFLLAANKLGAEPSDSLVIEDSKFGITAAKSAGMKVIAIDATGENKELEEADLVVSGFGEITQKQIDLL